ncbi:MAG: tetratricopeptide repeat protein [Prevotellaceae bacterium]|jgi:tetratricopeptide (TPR) repeat protein|nr:tetratricopeptide repeat protein [Prevotellaceae bacterium]
MQKILLSILIAALSLQLSAQDCSQDENLVRFMTRGKAALKTAEKPEDYKLAVAEFKKALEYDAKCVDIYEQLAVCYEQLGKLDPGNYRQAINYLNTCLSFRPDVPNKQEIQEKVYELEFLLEKAGGMSLDNLIGKWKFYWGNGNKGEFFDIEIFKNQGNFYIRYLCDYREKKFYDLKGKGKNERVVVRSCENKKKSPYNEGYCIDKNDFCTSIMKYADGIISFGTSLYTEKYLFWTFEMELNEGNSRYYELQYNLKYDNEKLAGDRICNRYKVCGVYAGNDDKSWKCSTDCTGDCGDNKVYFVKQ